MKQYIDIVNHVIENGKEKRPVRKNEQTGKWEPVDGGITTIACPNVIFSHDMSDGFPLLTTKKMAWKSIRVELEGFIKGITNKKWFQERGCHIWDEWCNPETLLNKLPAMMPPGTSEEKIDNLRKEVQASIDDLGPIYGYQWRNFDKQYGDINFHESEWKYNSNGLDGGADQLANIVKTLQENPMDRRMVCSAWNPNQTHIMALPPCHYAWDCTVIGDELSLSWSQRSCDLMLGVPFNIASYALLLCLLADVGGFKRGNLTGKLTDCHIYENHIDGAMKQITRKPKPLPRVDIVGPYSAPDGNFDIFNWTHEDVVLQNYNPLEKIDFGRVAI